MRVALSFPGCHRRAGVERIVFECARHLNGRGHEVHVFASEWETDGASSGVRYHDVPCARRPRFLRGPRYFNRCADALQTVDYDVLNTHGCVCPTGGVQWVQSLHAAWLDRSRAIRRPWSAGRWKQRLNPLHPVLLRLERRHFRERAYKRVIATTADVRRDLRDYYDVPEDDVSVIPNGFSPTEFSPERRRERRDAERKTLGLRPDQIALLFVANELERKGYRTILSALRILQRPDLRLLVVGKPSAEVVMRQAAEAGVASQVIACGATNYVAKFHAAADLFVLPTQYEAFCLAILEALGSGLPVVTSRVPGAKDAVLPGVNGATIADPCSGEELAAAILPLLDDEKRRAISNAAPTSVERFQWPTVLRRYEAELMACASR